MLGSQVSLLTTKSDKLVHCTLVSTLKLFSVSSVQMLVVGSMFLGSLKSYLWAFAQYKTNLWITVLNERVNNHGTVTVCMISLPLTFIKTLFVQLVFIIAATYICSYDKIHSLCDCFQSEAAFNDQFKAKCTKIREQYRELLDLDITSSSHTPCTSQRSTANGNEEHYIKTQL